MALALGLLSAAAQAQPSVASREAYGDRQSGIFSDPGVGYFGDPAFGNFDTDGVRTPPPGTRPLGRLYQGRLAEPPPYISLPEPPVEKPAAVSPEAKKKPASKRAS